MSKSLIVGYDGSQRAKDALVLTRLVAGDYQGNVTVVTAYPYHRISLSSGAGGKGYDAEMRAAAEKTLTEAQELLGMEVERRIVAAKSPARALHDVAEEEKADLVIVGSSHHGTVGRITLGSVAERLLHGAPCAVAVAPHGYAEHQQPLSTIVVAYDGGEEAKHAVSWALELAALEGNVRVHLLAIAEPFTSLMTYPAPAAYDLTELNDSLEEHLRQELQAAEDQYAGNSVEVTTELARGIPWRVLVERSDEEDTSLIVVGSRGYGALARVMLGSTSAHLVRSAHCPVVVVPG